MTSAQLGQEAADHDCWIFFCLQQNMRQHGSGGSLAVGTGHADGVAVGLHNHAPGLGPFKHRDTSHTGSSDLRVVVVGCSGADNAASALDIFGPVADGDLNALGDQFIGRDRGIHIRAGDQQAHALQHQTQRTHGNAANAYQVHMVTGLDKIMNIKLCLDHIFNILRCSIWINLSIIHQTIFIYNGYSNQI